MKRKMGSKLGITEIEPNVIFLERKAFLES